MKISTWGYPYERDLTSAHSVEVLEKVINRRLETSGRADGDADILELEEGQCSRVEVPTVPTRTAFRPPRSSGEMAQAVNKDI